MIKDKVEPTFTLRNLKKDLATINDAAKSYGLKLPMASQALEVYNTAVEEGFGDIDYTAILSFLKESTKVENQHK